MNLLKKAALSISFLTSMVSASIRIEGVSCNNVPIAKMPEVIVGTNETKSQYFDDIRIEVTLTDTKFIIFDLAKKDENNNFISFYRTALVLAENETEVGFASTNGFSLVVRVHEIKE